MKFEYAIALVVLGYAVFYYAINVLVWARIDATADPVPLSKCLGF